MKAAIDSAFVAALWGQKQRINISMCAFVGCVVLEVLFCNSTVELFDFLFYVSCGNGMTFIMGSRMPSSVFPVIPVDLSER